MRQPMFGFIQMFSILSQMNFVSESILSSLDLGSHLFSSFFQTMHRSPLGRAPILAFATMVNDASLVASIKSLYPLLFAAFA